MVDAAKVRDFELSIRVRNNRIKARRVALGLSQSECARQAGVSNSDLCAYETLRVSPIGKRGWKTSARKVASFFRVEPEDVWPEAMLAVRRPVITWTVDSGELMAIAAPRERPALPDVETMAIDAEQVRDALDAVQGLDRVRRLIVTMRFGLADGTEYTLRQIGEAVGLSCERTRQLLFQSLALVRKHLSTDAAIERTRALGSAPAAIRFDLDPRYDEHCGSKWTAAHGPPKTTKADIDEAIRAANAARAD